MSDPTTPAGQCRTALLALPGVHALCVAEGYSPEALKVVRFRDTREDLRWWERDCEGLGYIGAICDGGRPLHPKTVLASAREAFGPDVSVLWP